MILNEIKCHVNTSLGLVRGIHPLYPPCVRTWRHQWRKAKDKSDGSKGLTPNTCLCYRCCALEEGT